MRLCKFFETSSAVYLLLEYARGGKLWDHLSCYQNSPENSGKDFYGQTVGKIAIDKDHGYEKPTDTFYVDVAIKTTPAVQDSTPAVHRSSEETLLSSVIQSDSSLVASSTGNSCDKQRGTEVNDKLPSHCTKDKQGNKRAQVPAASNCFTSSVQGIPVEHIRIWAAELVLAVAYLHTTGIICRY